MTDIEKRLRALLVGDVGQDFTAQCREWDMLRAAARLGAEDMRERAANWVDLLDNVIADGIRALPLLEES